MDDYTDDAGQQQADPLAQFEGLFKSPAGQAMAQEARIRIADYAQKRQIAEDNMAAGQALHDNLGEMRSNFTDMVKSDPASVDLALDLAHLGVSATVGTIPGVPQVHGENVVTDMQRDIARSAVMSLADRHEDAARDMLDHPRVSDLLGDERDQLSGYITGQATARKIDAAGAQKMAAQGAVQQANQSAWGYMAAMVDPDTGELSHPPGWAEKVMGDQAMPPHYKAALFDTYGRLQEDGDATHTDPDRAADLLRSAAMGSLAPLDPLSRAGNDLRAADAVYLSKLASDPGQRGRAGQIADAIDLGRQQLAAPENGPAGQRALNQFTDWAMGAARSGADLDPSSKEYALAGNRLQQFAPRASDNVDSIVQVPTQERRPLAEIFGSRNSV